MTGTRMRVSILGSVVYVHGATRLMGLSSLVHTQSGWIGYINGRIYQFLSTRVWSVYHDIREP